MTYIEIVDLFCKKNVFIDMTKNSVDIRIEENRIC